EYEGKQKSFLHHLKRCYFQVYEYVMGEKMSWALSKDNNTLIPIVEKKIMKLEDFRGLLKSKYSQQIINKKEKFDDIENVENKTLNTIKYIYEYRYNEGMREVNKEKFSKLRWVGDSFIPIIDNKEWDFEELK